MKTFLSLLPLACALVLGGCAAGANDADETSTAAVSASAPITLANWIAHPRIVEVRETVKAIDKLSLTRTENPGCDGGNVKFTDGSGTIRKLVSNGGEGGFSSEWTYYYDASGKPRFAFNVTRDDERGEAKQQRAYYDASGAPIWHVIRAVPITSADADPDFSKGVDREPSTDLDDPDAIEIVGLSPEEIFASTSCPQRR